MCSWRTAREKKQPLNSTISSWSSRSCLVWFVVKCQWHKHWSCVCSNSWCDWTSEHIVMTSVVVNICRSKNTLLWYQTESMSVVYGWYVLCSQNWQRTSTVRWSLSPVVHHSENLKSWRHRWKRTRTASSLTTSNSAMYVDSLSLSLCMCLCVCEIGCVCVCVQWQCGLCQLYWGLCVTSLTDCHPARSDG